jgi:tryptophan synthase beta chain
MTDTKVTLSERDIPKKWYNIMADMPHKPLPPLHPGTGKPVGPDDLAPIFPMGLIMQEVSTQRYIPIPEEVLNIYTMWRPTPMFRARRLEQFLQTPAKIYYKYEGVSPAGSHKPNTAVAQAYYNKKEGVKRIASETGAGQWGSALAFACNVFGMDCKVYMVKVSYDSKPYRKTMMKTWGASVVSSPSRDTNAGRTILAQFPDSPGSLGIAISEAVEDAVTHDHTKYSLGSVLNHVLLHQTVVGQEMKKQMAKVGDYPDVVIGCIGGGSNFAGFAFPFLQDKLDGKRRKTRIVAVEPAACPSLTKGVFAYDFGDTAKMTPLLPMYTLGHDFIPASIHAGGLRYHGMAPLVCQLYRDGLIEARACSQLQVFEAAKIFASTEGIIPAPEASHAIKAAIDEALEAKARKKKQVIIFNLSGHGFFDMSAYESYINGTIEDYELPDEEIRRALTAIKDLPKPEPALQTS